MSNVSRFRSAKIGDQGMAIFGLTGTEVVMVVDRSGIQRAGKLAVSLEHYEGQLPFAGAAV